MYGLKPLPKDDRDFRAFDGKLGSGLFDQPDVKVLPKDFLLSPIFQYDQGQTDACSAYATAGAKSIVENRRLHAPSLFGFSKLISGDPHEWGQDHRTIRKALVKFGAIFEDEIPEELRDKDVSWWRDPANWNQWAERLFDLAAKNRDESFVAVAGRYDPFDDIRTMMWKFRNERRAVTFGLLWDYDPQTPYIITTSENGYGHLVYFSGWKTAEDGTEYLILQNSWGSGVGDQGRFYITRDEVNAMAERYGVYMGVDLPAEIARYYAENGAKTTDNWVVLMVKAIQRAIIDLLEKAISKAQNAPRNDETPQKVSSHVPSKYLLPALVWQESWGVLNAIGDNGMAYGPLQIWDVYMKDVFPHRHARECLNNLPLSIQTYEGYMKRYATEKRLGRPVTDQDIARIHNGGPAGWKNPRTLAYWYQVQSKMKQLEQGTAPASIVKRLQALALIA